MVVTMACVDTMSDMNTTRSIASLAAKRRMMMRTNSEDKDHFCSLRYSLSEDSLPEMKQASIRIKVCFVGACAPDVIKAKQQIRNKGLLDTSLFPGYEFSGIVDEICPQLVKNGQTTLKPGDKCIIYPEDDLGFQDGISQYVMVENIENIIPIPETLSMEMAALLPCGGLTAYAAIRRAQSYITQLINQSESMCNILVIGAGGLGLWTMLLASYITDCENDNLSGLKYKIVVADTNSEQLQTALAHDERFGIIHWPCEAYEEVIEERTKNACPSGFNLIIDFVSCPRSISRAMKCLIKGGVIVVGGNAQYEIPINLSLLASNEQTLLGVRRGTRDELKELVHLVADDKVSTPQYQKFPLHEVETVYKQLSDCKIKGRALIEVSPI